MTLLPSALAGFPAIMEIFFTHLPDVVCRPFLVVARSSAAPETLRTVLNIVLAIAFLLGVLKIIEGGAAIWRGDAADGKMGLISGVMIAGVSVFVKVIYESFALPTGFE